MSRIRLGALFAAAGLLLATGPVQADQYPGNGNTGFGGAIGNGTLTLSDDGTNISGTLSVGGSMDDVLVLYIQSGPGGFTNTSGFNDQADACRQAISGVSASGRSLLTFASGFQPNYAIALSPTAAGTGGLWQLANGGNNSLVYMGSVNLAPLNRSGPYTFSFPAALVGMIPGVRSTIQVFGTYVRTDGSRSTETIAGNLNGTQGWNPFTQTAYASYTFDASAVIVKLPLGVWTQCPGPPPAARYDHTAVWTGSEMIVWGGYGASPYFNDGGRYNPAANIWTALPTSGAPAVRSSHTAVWTGSEMLIWGGYGSTGPGITGVLGNGGRYNPTANRWTALSRSGEPRGRELHTAVWTGSEMIVWGGSYYSGASVYLNDGGRYNPATNTWTALPTSSAPAGRVSHTAVWTGSEMVIWGGNSNTGILNDGGRYSPAANRWTGLASSGAPAARRNHTAVWTDSEMIVWGGIGGGYLNSGGRYNSTADIWTALPTSSAPAGRASHTAVWTGSEMIVWGGGNSSPMNDGGRFNPTANVWTTLSASGVPAARSQHTAVWTSSEMIVWGGGNGNGGYFNDGGRYNPGVNTWTAVPNPSAPAARYWHTAVWTGSEMIVCGGCNETTLLGDATRYNPAANSWTTLPASGASAGRYQHTAVWTGTEMIVWGGWGTNNLLNTGARYNPLANSWTMTTTDGAPSARILHTAVWTGTEMIVWGGDHSNSSLNDGGRYNPVANTWTSLPTSGAPAARESHMAVWTGSEMIIWGGGYYSGAPVYLNDGARYNPAANNWTTLPTSSAPAGRVQPTAVWTGSEMIVWGGASGILYFNDGGRYNPAANTWTTLSTSGVPAARRSHTAVWTGSEMIVWGGYGNTGCWNDGGRYSPAANSWAVLPTTGTPAARYWHTAVWTGSQMIVFGGYDDKTSDRSYFSDTWSYYSYAPAVRFSPFGSTSAVVAWPVWSSTLRLCQTTNLSAGQWTTVTNAVTQVGAENHVTVSPLSGGQFFRAVYP